MQHKSRHRARRVAGEGNLRLRLLHEELARRLRPQPDCPAAGAGASEKRLALKGHLELDARSESVLPDERGKHRAREDRKSTRLNSSHGYISYAVFCLKKKKYK